MLLAGWKSCVITFICRCSPVTTRILKRMNRKYTRERLPREDPNGLRAVCPDIAITSDFIVGFPGETDVNFRPPWI
jgi:tRNA A37 methylthiotransferase MiaB